MVEFLLKKGAAITTENYQGETALHFATQFDHRATVALLLDLGADITAKNKKGWTPLHFAALEGYTTMVELLLKEGADITEKQNEGLTALHLVKREYTTSQLLLEYNAGLLYMSDDEKRKTLRDLNSTQLKALSLSAIEILYPHPSKKNIYITTVAELSAVLSPEEKLALAYKWPKGASKCTFMPEGVREITKQALSERRAIRQAAEYFCYFEELNKGKNNENDQLQKKQETESLRKQQESPFPFYSYYNQLPKEIKHIICTLATGAVCEPNDGELIKIKFGVRS